MTDKEFEISVITPYHNVNPDFFRKCADSVIGQTLGLEKIQWIVVLHNCSEDYRKAAYEILGDHPEIETYELNNDACTPSSPRNYGLQFAKGRYIGFLDGDDSFTPEALEEAIRHNEKHHAQIVVFRREHELENRKAVPLKDTVLWDQLQEEIVVDPKHSDTEKIFSGPCGMTTSKIYLREFLEKNDLKFDEDVLFAEDYLFILEIFGKAEKVLFLPQLIGYHYFVNMGSLVQSSAKDGPTLIKYAEGYVKIFEKGLQQGFYMNCIIQRICLTLSRFMARKNDQLSLEDRIHIKELLEPYLLLTTPLKPGKLCSAKQCEEYFSFPREVILHPEKWMEADERDILVTGTNADVLSDDVMNTVLREIIDENSETDFGTHYRFSELMTVSGYQHCVPVTDYSYYRPLIRLATKIGQTKLMCSEDVFTYVYTSGTTGHHKLIPFTLGHIAPYVSAFRKIVDGHHTMLLMESSFVKVQYNDDAFSNSLYGQIISAFFSQANSGEENEESEFSAPRELMFPNRAVDTTYERLFFALKDRSIDQIYAPYTWGVLDTLLLLKKKWKALCSDIERGELSTKTKITSKLREKLSKIIAPDPERAEELRRIFSMGFDSDTLKKVWPKLERVVANGTGEMQIYSDALSSLLGDVSLTNGLFASAECLAGEPTGEKDVYELCGSSCFFEFRETEGERLILQHHEILPGREYELIITSSAGLYRYATEDIIRIVSASQNKILFRFVRRAGENEKLSLALYPVLRSVSSELSVPIADYSFRLGNEENSGELLIIWEAPNDIGDISKILRTDKAVLGEKIKEKLMFPEINKVQVIFGQPETHLLYRDALRDEGLYSSDQIQPVRALDDPEKIHYFTTFELMQ